MLFPGSNSEGLVKCIAPIGAGAPCGEQQWEHSEGSVTMGSVLWVGACLPPLQLRDVFFFPRSKECSCSEWSGEKKKLFFFLCSVTQKSGKPLVAAAWHQSIPSALWSAKTSISTPFSNKIFSCISVLPSPCLSTISSLLHLLCLIKNTWSCLWCEAYNRTAVTREIDCQVSFHSPKFSL